jgi:adenylate kinase family enzyme
MPIRRIVILGCSGSGKTTLAVELGRLLELPVVHLDRLYWRPGWQVPDEASFYARVQQAIAGDRWVSEGNYRETFPLRLPRADLVVVLQRSRWVCLRRVLWRSLVARGRRPDLPDGCPEHVDWPLLQFIWRFYRATWPRIEAARAEHGADVRTIRLRRNREITAFLASIAQSPALRGE